VLLTWDLYLPFPLSYSFVHFFQFFGVFINKVLQGFHRFKVSWVHYYWLPWSTVDYSWPWKCGATWWVLDPMRSWLAKALTLVLGVSAQPALVGVMPNIWPGFGDQVVDKWMTEKNEWMNGSIESPKKPSPPSPPILQSKRW
jgi:hypothetical protein